MLTMIKVILSIMLFEVFVQQHTRNHYIRQCLCMNAYIVCNPYRFTTGAPTPKSKPNGLVWSQLGDLKEKILEHAAITHKEEYRQGFTNPLLPDTSIMCQVTWIFKRKRRSILSEHGELEVTINRKMLDRQKAKMTPEEKETYRKSLEYEQTWPYISEIILHKYNSQKQQYNVKFVHLNNQKQEIIDSLPDWVLWRENKIHEVFENQMLLGFYNDYDEHDYEEKHYSIAHDFEYGI